MLYSQLEMRQRNTAITPDKPICGLTEMVLPNHDELSLILPTLAFLTNQYSDRWLTWISHSPKINRSQLQYYGFNLNRLRIVHTKSSDQAFCWFREALVEGNSHTVIGTLTEVNEAQSSLLEQAAIDGQCVALLLRSRQSQPH